MSRLKGFAALGLSGFIFGSFGIWIRLLSRELTSFQQIAVRNLFGLVLAIVIVFILRQRWNFEKANKLHLFLYGFFYPVTVILYVFAVLNAKIASVTFAFYAAAYVCSFLVGTFYFKDKLTSSKVGGLILALMGLAFLGYPFSLAVLSFGLLCGLLSGLFDSGTNSFRRLVGGKVDRFVLVAWQMLAGVLVAMVLLLVYQQPLPLSLSLFAFGISMVFGFLLVSISFLTLVGFQNFDLGLGTIVMSSELLFAPLFAWLAFGEWPLVNELMGGLFICFSIVVANLSVIGSSKNLASPEP